MNRFYFQLNTMLVFWLLFFSSACRHQTETTESFGQDIRLAPVGKTFSSTGEYIIDSLDLIEVYVHNHPEFSSRYRVDRTGFITMPRLGQVRAKGRSAQLLRTAISIKLRPFVRHPRVAISVAEPSSYRVIFSGSIRKPGIHTMDGRTTLIEGLAIAGGVTRGSEQSITIIREDEKGVRRRFSTTYQEIMTGSPVLDNFVLERGDIVYVNE